MTGLSPKITIKCKLSKYTIKRQRLIQWIKNVTQLYTVNKFT